MFRILILARIKRSDRRLFYLFWLWPLLIFLQSNLVPLFACRGDLYQIVEVLLLVGLILDGLYYFLLKSVAGNRHQWFSLALILPCLCFSLRDQWSLRPAIMELPHYGRAQVWTDRVFFARTYYFMVPASQHQNIESDFEDPNFGRAVFAPLTGTVAGWLDSDYLVLESQALPQLQVSIGPLIRQPNEPERGDAIEANQPLGLLAGSGSVPGIRLRIESGPRSAFQNFFAGRRLARRFAVGTPKRNQFAQSDAPNRFRLQ